MQDNCIAVALGLPELRVLRQKEQADRFEIEVIYRREGAVCPRCGSVTKKEHDRMGVEEYLSKLIQPEKVKAVAMDMHEPFRQAVQMCLPQARVVVDKFHVIRHINAAMDRVRTRLQGGTRKGKRSGLFRSRYILLEGAEQLSDHERKQLGQLLLIYPELEEAWKLKEGFRQWYQSTTAQQSGTDAANPDRHDISQLAG